MLSGKQSAGHQRIGLAFVFFVSSTVVVHGRSHIRVTHQLLLHTNRSSLVIEDCPVSVPEGVPTEIRDSNRLPCRVQMIIPQRIGMERPAGIHMLIYDSVCPNLYLWGRSSIHPEDAQILFGLHEGKLSLLRKQSEAAKTPRC